MVNIVPQNFEKLGAVFDGSGVTFSIFSEGADYIELCLFDGRYESRHIMPARTDDGVWHGYIKDITPGTRYGYRVYGAYEPENGKRFNPNKLLIDPYAKELDSEFMWHDSLLGYDKNVNDNACSTTDSAQFVAKSVVIDERGLIHYPTAQRPQTPWHQTIIYEAHIKGFTKNNNDIHQIKRGTFAGFSEKKVIEYIKSMGITAIEFLPIFACNVDRYLGPSGLVNYWGYDTVGFFAPRYSFGSVLEFKKMVNSLHDAGIEVILDVVYNHTGDSDETGPTISFKGIDNAYYYKLDNDKSRYKNFAGCGNVLDINKPYVKKLIQDSLVYWSSLGVDGFRFDLASVLGRDENNNFSQNSQFFSMIKETKELANCKLIAEPWDATGEGFQLGNYPNNFKQWNGVYRDIIRNSCSSRETKRGDIAYALSGSDNLGNNNNNSLSINYVFAHDGFTMADYFTYSHKRNENNPWDNNDGPNEYGFNCGEDGNSKNPKIIEERFLRMRNSFTMLFLSVGTPMIMAGDEVARTQSGNNNAYCQDNDISWINWDLNKEQSELCNFVATLTKFRTDHSDIIGEKLLTSNDIAWINNNGQSITGDEWNDTKSLSLNYLLKDEIFIIINLNDVENDVKMPAGHWEKVISTNPKYDINNGTFKTNRQEIAVFIKEK